MGRPYKCPYCGASRSIGRGIRRTKALGRRRVRECKGCGRRYTPQRQKMLADVSDHA